MRFYDAFSRTRTPIILLSMLALSLVIAPPARAGDPIDVGDQVRALVEQEWIALDAEFQTTPHGAMTTQLDAVGGCDGVKNGSWGFHVASNESNPWWQVDLGDSQRLDRIVVFNRTDGGCAPRSAQLQVLVADVADGPFTKIYQHNGETFYGLNENAPLVVDLSSETVDARIVRLAITGNCSLALDEIEVFAAADPETNIAIGKPCDQISICQHSNFSSDIGEGTFSAEHIEHVLTQADGLAERLLESGGNPRLTSLKADLASLRQRASQSSETSDVNSRRELYLEARWAARSVAFCNPKFDIDRLLFITRHHPTGPYHMCDQFYGCNAVPGGRLLVLEDPFSDSPQLRDLLDESTVENGRLEGRRLENGAFLSPELSFDGEEIYFAFSECGATETYQWFPETSFHIFKCDADGSNLTQLTDGDTDDFDPCCLPDGRVAFITEQRGGYLRCGRECPVYTMFSMEPDGSDVVTLSYHETHEWQPSVDNSGMLVYTRWDYVDRDTNIAHHLWHCFPDGRDPRSFHGNYPVRREDRPWMEMDIRAVPDSSRFVATTGAHHGNALGSLVLINTRKPDDRAMSQLEVVTPDCPFPEASGRGTIKQNSRYGTAWPLSEDDYLCMYDRDADNHGIYWIDRYGNRELLFRDPSIPCASPMPLSARPMPPIIPSATTQTARDIASNGGVRPSTVGVMNIYESDFDWPEGTRVEELRVVQVLAKATAPPNVPRIGVADQTNARRVLGTVPVEADGSCFFECPPGKAIYFQAIDQNGLAVMSMRSATYLHPGEQLTCIGCHESKHEGTTPLPNVPLAMRREPSILAPEVEGSNPFNYVQLVQPVLDRHCVACHEEEGALDLAGELGGPNGWTQSYANLAPQYGFYFNVRNGSINDGVHGGTRTTPGQFGAAVAPLSKYLTAEHYDVDLPEDDMHRLRLWLDLNSEFYGAYEQIELQAQGFSVIPSLE